MESRRTTRALRLGDSPYTTFLAQRFDRTWQGIRLSPAYDINPVPDRTELTLAINETDTHCDVDIAMQAHRDYGLSNEAAVVIVKQMRKAVAGWRSAATALKIPSAEQARMATAFVG